MTNISNLNMITKAKKKEDIKFIPKTEKQIQHQLVEYDELAKRRKENLIELMPS